MRFVEINPQCKAPFQAAARRITTETRLTFHVSAAGSDAQQFLADTDVVVVDPPRKGLELALLEALCRPPGEEARDTASLAARALPRNPGSGGTAAPSAQSQPQQPHTLIYLSCGFPALERDCTALLQSGHWRLQHCAAFLFFPGTDSLETLAIFCRH